jgi:hypothetical protein
MKRRAAFAAIAGVLGWSRSFAAEPPPVEIFVGPGKDVRFTFHFMDRKQVVGILSTFFGNGREIPEARFKELLTDAGELTLVLTTAKASVK